MPTASKKDTAGIASADEIERFFAMKDRDTAPAWRPDPDTMMAGELQGFRIGPDNGYGTYPIMIYKLDNGQVISVHAFHTLLRESLKEMHPKKGDRHLIHYAGKQETNASIKKGDNSDRQYYHMYYIRNAADLTADDAVQDTFDF